MKIFYTVDKLQAYIKKQKKKKKRIGFVPTMGALHEGHLALAQMSKNENDITVCSIFVNPTQFNDKKDLAKYPRTLESDVELLETIGTEVVFAPDVDEMYPDGTAKTVKVNLKGLDKALEGEFRPGHFDGVVQVVHRLLDIVKPHRLYMGQKDFQQFTIIKKMIKNLKMKVRLVVHPIERAVDGLALSSRNKRLSDAKRKWAPIIYMTMLRAKQLIKTQSVEDVISISIAEMAKPLGFKPEYFSIVDGNTLLPIKKWKDSSYIVAITAVWAGDVRLIDNLILKKKK